MNYILLVCTVFVLSQNHMQAQTDTSAKGDSSRVSLRVHMTQLPALLLPQVANPILWGNTTSVSAQPLLWPGLQPNVVRLQRWPTFTCTNILAPMGPDDGLWQLMDDGGLVRRNGSNLEYEAPAIFLR